MRAAARVSSFAQGIISGWYLHGHRVQQEDEGEAAWEEGACAEIAGRQAIPLCSTAHLGCFLTRMQYVSQ